MKLIHFAISLTFVLIGLTAYVAWQAHIEARGARKEIQLFRQQQNAQIAQGAVPMPGVLDDPTNLPPPPTQLAPTTPPPTIGTLSPVTPGAAAPAIASSLPSVTANQPESSLPPVTVAPEPPPTLTAEQRQVLSLPAIARVKSAVTEQGFVVIDAGTNQNLTAGMQFKLRRGSAVVGAVTISQTIEATESIADITPGSIPPGVTLQSGDQLIQAVGF